MAAALSSSALSRNCFTENGAKADLRLVFASARAVSDRLTWFLHLLLCHRPCEPFPLSSGSQHRI
jgi:hypothetical protein